MAKVVYNSCYGGFSLSEAGMLRYCEIKGIPVWVERDPRYNSSSILPPTYWIVPPHDRPDYLDGDASMPPAWRSGRRRTNAITNPLSTSATSRATILHLFR